MQLICPPIILAGIAIVTACNANEVKVQLKGGTTGLLNVTEATVNRIGLGKAWDSLGEIEEGGETWNPGVTSNDTIRFFIMHLVITLETKPECWLTAPKAKPTVCASQF